MLRESYAKYVLRKLNRRRHEMKNKKIFIRVVMSVLALAFIFLGVVSSAKQTSQDLDGAIVGEYCFKLDSYPDTWHWRVNDLGNKFYQIVGFDHAFPGNSQVGSGHRQGSHFYATVMMTIPDDGKTEILGIDLNLITMTGTVDITWLRWDGAVGATFENLTFSEVVCPGP